MTTEAQRAVMRKLASHETKAFSHEEQIELISCVRLRLVHAEILDYRTRAVAFTLTEEGKREIGVWAS